MNETPGEVIALEIFILVKNSSMKMQDLRADILQPAANSRDQTVIIQTGGGTILI